MPFIIQFPSQLTVAAATTTVAVSPVNAEGQAGLLDIDVARIRGDICHRLLETLAEGQPWPSPERVAAALRQEGLAPEPAADLAADILAEVRACLADPFLARLLSPDVPQAMNEWRLEDEAAPGLLRRGRVDRLVYDGEVWWLLDYKTGRPQAEEDWEPFIAAEVEKYRPQLAAYRDMAAKALRLNSGAPLRLVLYFTACQRAVDLPLS